MFLSAAAGFSQLQDETQSSSVAEGLKLNVDVDNLRTSLPPPSELSPVRPMALYRNHNGHHNRKRMGAPQRNPLTRKGSDPGLTAMFRSAATGGMPRTPPATTGTPPPGPGLKRRELAKAQVLVAQRTTNRTIVFPSAPPIRFDIGKRPVQEASAGASLAPPLRLPTLMVTRASTEVSQLHLMDEAERREGGQELTNEQSSSAPSKVRSTFILLHSMEFPNIFIRTPQNTLIRSIQILDNWVTDFSPLHRTSPTRFQHWAAASWAHNHYYSQTIEMIPGHSPVHRLIRKLLSPISMFVRFQDQLLNTRRRKYHRKVLP